MKMCRNKNKREGSALGMVLMIMVMAMGLLTVLLTVSLKQYEKAVTRYQQKQLYYLTRSLAATVEKTFTNTAVMNGSIQSMIIRRLEEEGVWSDQFEMEGLEELADQIIIGYDYREEEEILTIMINAEKEAIQESIIIDFEKQGTDFMEWQLLQYRKGSFYEEEY